jgi:hypothetical protein
MGGGRNAATADSPAQRESNVVAAGAAAELEEAEAAGRLRRCFRYVGGVQLSPEDARRVLFAVRACGHAELTLPPAVAAAAAVAPSRAGAQAAQSPGAGGAVVFGVAFRVWLRDAEHAMIATAVAAASLAVIAKAAAMANGQHQQQQQQQQQQPTSGHSEEREEGEGGLAVVRRMHALLDTALATAAAAPPSGPRQAPSNAGSNIGARPWLGLDAMDGDVWMDDAQVRQLCARLAVAGGDYRYSYSLTYTYSTLASCTPPVCILVAGCLDCQ